MPDAFAGTPSLSAIRREVNLALRLIPPNHGGELLAIRGHGDAHPSPVAFARLPCPARRAHANAFGENNLAGVCHDSPTARTQAGHAHDIAHGHGSRQSDRHLPLAVGQVTDIGRRLLHRVGDLLPRKGAHDIR